MFSFIRMILSVLLLVIFLFLINYFTKKNKRRWYIVLLVCFVLSSSALAFVPFEDTFFRFSSPESAFRYYYPKANYIDLIIEGNESTYVVGSESDRFKYLIIPKEDKGWKVGLGIYTQTVHSEFTNNVVIHIYRFKDTADYYIRVLDPVNGQATVADSCGSEFFCIKDETGAEPTFLYLAHISDFSDSYYVCVNGMKIFIHP